MIAFFFSCSNRKNTALTRTYHSVNTRYNVYFNAEEAYKESLNSKIVGIDDNLSTYIYMYPFDPELDPLSESSSGGGFTTTIDKCTKAIQLHSITTRPRKDASRRNDENYQAWLQQKEFNPFLKNVWLLLGKSEYENGEYLKAATTLSYIPKIYSSDSDIVAECQLWKAQAYIQMNWLYEAEDIFRKLAQSGGVPESQQKLYAKVYANLLARNGEFEKSIPYLQQAISSEKNKHQKTRMRYLLGQTYERLGDSENAYEAYSRVKGIGTSYKYIFNSRLKQLSLSTDSSDKIVSELNKMTKNHRNEDYLDQIYSSIAQMSLKKSDTAKAIENYKKAIEKSTRNGYDKMVVDIALGKIFFDRREYVPAQPYYASALASITKSDSAYATVTQRSAFLDELVVHVKTVHEQDSLQHLAKLPEDERLAIINKQIEDLKKEEKERQKEEDRQARIQEIESGNVGWGDLTNNAQPNKANLVQPLISQDGESFYFYNPQVVTQGKASFQRMWGNRKLEDDWRRRNKAVAIFADNLPDDNNNNPEENTPSETVQDTLTNKANTDVLSVEFYLQQLPLTDDMIAQSNSLIDNAYYQMGRIYKEKLGDLHYAAEAYIIELNRFPDTPNKEDVYYQLFLIYMQLDQRDQMVLYRNKLLAEYPSGLNTIALSDPNYEWNLKNMVALQNTMYDEAYNAYLTNDIKTVRNKYTELQAKYPQSALMPKFMLLNGLTYAQERNTEELKSQMLSLVEQYQKEDVAELATAILDRIKDGHILLSDGQPIRGIDWNIPFEGETGDESAKIMQYSDTIDSEYYLLLAFKTNSIDRNNLIYQIADYNFTNYIVQTFDIGYETFAPYDILMVKGFDSFGKIQSYINRAFTEDGLIQHIDKQITPIPITIDNYKLLTRFGLEEYIEFVNDRYKDELPNLVKHIFANEVATEDSEVDINNPEEKPSELPVVDNDDREERKDDIIVPDKPIEDIEKEDIGVNINDYLPEDAKDVIGDVNEIVDAAENVMDNPVDGIKGLLNTLKSKPKLTKEEKEEQKRLEKEERAQERIRKAAGKAMQDSIAKREKIVEDSIRQIQDQAKEEKKRIEKENRDAQKAKEREAENIKKQREQDRKNIEIQRKEAVRKKEEERKKALKEREVRRKEIQKAQELKRKEQESRKK